MPTQQVTQDTGPTDTAQIEPSAERNPPMAFVRDVLRATRGFLQSAMRTEVSPQPLDDTGRMGFGL